MFKRWGDRQRLKFLSSAVNKPHPQPSQRIALIIFNAEEAKDRETIKHFAASFERTYKIRSSFLGVIRRNLEKEHLHGYDQIGLNNLDRYGYVRLEQYAHFTQRVFSSIMNFDLHDSLNIHHFIHSLNAHQKITCSATVSHLYDLVIQVPPGSGVEAYTNETMALFSKIMR